MPGNLVTAGTLILCPHGGVVGFTPTSAAVVSAGMALATFADQFMVTGCPLAGPNLKPCTKALWSAPATRVFIGGQPALYVPNQIITDGSIPVPAMAVLIPTPSRVVVT